MPAAGRTSYPEGRDRSPRRSPPRTAFSVRTVASTQATQATQVYSWETHFPGNPKTKLCPLVVENPDSQGFVFRWQCMIMIRMVWRWHFKGGWRFEGLRSACVFFAHKASSKTSGEMSSLGHTDCLCPYPLGDLIWPISMLLHRLHVLRLVNVPDTESSVDEPTIHASGRIDDVEIAPRVRRSR